MDTCNGKHKIWLAKQTFPLWNDRIEDQTIYIIATDVSELVMARNAAEAATQQIEMLQDMAGVGYWSIDIIEGTVTWSNEVHRIHRTDPDTFQPTLELGLNFYHPDDVDEVSQIVDVAIQNGKAFGFKKRIIAVDKTEVHIEPHGLAINDPDGNTVRVVGVFREI
ncbi:PAS domain-containing protein [Sulfitobacter sp. JB4-11]|uniref:PAS domain-containing protein n=1 Tax=Sulfitobacter rhodophyticola TaxID=3238304 RepID=UPI003516313B